MPVARVGAVIPFLPAIAVFILLALFVDVDPSAGFTFSNSPFTDEAWWLANARNFALFGQWSTDDWNLHLVNPVYSALQAVVLLVAGVDIIPARLAVIASVALTCLALALGLRRVLGDAPAFVAALAYGLTPLTLYYGRLAYAEPVVAFLLTCGALLVARPSTSRPVPFGVVGGLFLAAAVGAKPTALPLVIGMLLTLAIVDGRRSAWSRRWIGGAAAAIVACGLGWAVVALIPERDAVAVVGRILAQVTPPANVVDLIVRIVSYGVSNDGALLYTAPLIVGAVAGGLLARRFWPDLDDRTHRLVAIAIGWALFGLILLLVVPYRPNRYFLPLVPSLAILVAVAIRYAPRALPRTSAGRGRIISALVLIALLVPGILLHTSWVWNGTRELGVLQRNVAAALSPGSIVQGVYAPLLAFRAPAIAIVSRPESDVNAGDLYADPGVRWLVVEGDEEPAWASLHRSAWENREVVLCAPWGATDLCLVRLP